MMVITAPLVPKGIWVGLQVKQHRPNDPDSLAIPIVVRVESVSDPRLLPKVYVNSTAVGWDELRQALKEQLKIRREWGIYIDADSASSWQSAMSAVNVAGELNAKVVLLTPQTRKLVEAAGMEKNR
jgi:biopolymer transport protein ExbD